MQLIYRFALLCYTGIIHLLATFNTKAALWIKGRENWRETVRTKMQGMDGPYIWMHCASLGEFEQGRPLLEAFRRDYPKYKIVLTFFSPSGFEIRKNTPLADAVFYLPADSPNNSRDFIKLINPSLVFFVKYEFWYYYGLELRALKIPFYCVSAIFRPGQIFFSVIGTFFLKMLQRYDHIFVQDQESLSLLYKYGIKQVSVAGDTRFDRVWQNSLVQKELPLMDQFCDSMFSVMVAGSTWPQDELLLFEALLAIPELRLVIAPHELTPERMDGISKRFGVMSVLYSKADALLLQNKRVLVIDNIGLLSKLYRYGKLTYVGGGFGVGIHNTLEAAVYGKPVFFGPKYAKFREARELIKKKVAYSVNDGKELIILINKLLNDPTRLLTIADRGKSYISQNKGATEMIMNHLQLNFLPVKN